MNRDRRKGRGREDVGVARLLGRRWMVGAAMADREAWGGGDVSASDLSHLSGPRDGWDQAGMSATSARSTARTVAYAREACKSSPRHNDPFSRLPLDPASARTPAAARR